MRRTLSATHSVSRWHSMGRRPWWSVGSGSDGVHDAGAVFLFGSLGGVWSQTGTLLTGGAPIGDDMGWSVAVDRSTAMVAAPRDDHAGGVDAGAVYMFERSGGSWEARQKLTASDAQVGQNFGTAVAIQGDLAVIGAIGDDHSGFVDAGSAYVFRRQDGQWIEGQKLVAGAPEDNPGFGASVAISGQTVLVGASNADLGALIDAGAVYVFENTGGVWSEHQGAGGSGCEELAVFGTSVALDGDTALVGARGDDAGVGAAAGAAYFFTREQGVWSQHQKVTASDAEPGDTFGIVALEGATAVISSLFESPGGVFRAGSAYVFELHGSEWTEVAKLEASDKAEEDRFGRSLALAGDTLLVGRLPFRGPASTTVVPTSSRVLEEFGSRAAARCSRPWRGGFWGVVGARRRDGSRWCALRRGTRIFRLGSGVRLRNAQAR
jgi:hypothetical protein